MKEATHSNKAGKYNPRTRPPSTPRIIIRREGEGKRADDNRQKGERREAVRIRSGPTGEGKNRKSGKKDRQEGARKASHK